MKKALMLTSILLLLLAVNETTSPYNITIDQTFEYDVKRAEVFVKLDESTYSGKGFKINDVGFNQRTTIQATVNSLGGDNVLWTLFSGEESLAKLADWNLIDESSLSRNILNPFSIIQNFLTNPELVNDGLGLIFYPFLGTNRTIDFFKDLRNKTHYQYVFFMPSIDNVQFDVYLDENDHFITFESLVSGSLNQNLTTPEFNISFKHHSQLVYDTSIGLLYGSKLISEGIGIYENKTVTYNFESHTELKKYNLPRFILNSSNTPQKWWLIGISGGIIIITIILFLVRFTIKKKKN